MVLNEIFFRKIDGGRIAYFNPAEVEVKVDERGQRISATLKADSQPVEAGGTGTMSKSKNNGVDPQSLIEEYGADTARLFMMFASSPEDTLLWNDAGVEGASRFLKRLWNYAHDNHAGIAANHDAKPDWARMPEELKRSRREIHMALKQAVYDFAKFQFNTVVSAAMKILNALEGIPKEIQGAHNIAEEGVSILLRLLAPITPHIAHELWRELGYGADVMTAAWPEPDAQALIADEIELALQVNGKLRGNMQVARNADRAEIEALALQNANVQKHIDGKPVKKVVVVPGRLVNVVV
jgi:leucyl-tRNA synthetase